MGDHGGGVAFSFFYEGACGAQTCIEAPNATCGIFLWKTSGEQPVPSALLCVEVQFVRQAACEYASLIDSKDASHVSI